MKKKLTNFTVRGLLIFLSGLIVGLWISWPEILRAKSWSCAIKTVKKSHGKGTPVKAVLELSPNYFLNRRSYKGSLGKLRILGDACFR